MSQESGDKPRKESRIREFRIQKFEVPNLYPFTLPLTPLPNSEDRLLATRYFSQSK